MIDEAIGKILGMAMAYAVSGLGLFLAYVNYRRRIVKAERVMSGTAWAVVAVTLLVVAGGVVVVAQLAQPPAEVPVAEEAEVSPLVEPPSDVPAAEKKVAPDERHRWPWLGIVIPAGIFLAATVITAALHRHFSAPAAKT